MGLHAISDRFHEVSVLRALMHAARSLRENGECKLKP